MNPAGHHAPYRVEGNLRLAGIDSRIIALLKSIADCGSISRAAKQCGLSYRGAWQIIERANNSSSKVLVGTATGGSKGGGSCLTEAGQRLLSLFLDLEQQHTLFIDQLNRSLTENIQACLLLRRLAVKTSVRNQLFGTVGAISLGAINAQISVELAGGINVVAAISLETLNDLRLIIGAETVLLINSHDITLTTDNDLTRFSASNRLTGTVIQVERDDINCEISVMLPGGEILTSVVTTESLNKMALGLNASVSVVFNSNTPVLGVL